MCKCGGRKDTLLLLDDPGAKSSVQLSIHVLLELSASFNTISLKLFLFWALMRCTPDFLAVPFQSFFLALPPHQKDSRGLVLGSNFLPYLHVPPWVISLHPLGFCLSIIPGRSVPLSSISFVPVAEVLVWHLIT